MMECLLVFLDKWRGNWCCWPICSDTNTATFPLTLIAVLVCGQQLLHDLQLLRDDLQLLCDDLQLLCDGLQLLCGDLQLLRDDLQLLCADLQLLCDGLQLLCVMTAVLSLLDIYWQYLCSFWERTDEGNILRLNLNSSFSLLIFN